MTRVEEILHPFPDAESFCAALKAVGKEYFSKYNFTVEWSDASLLDAHAFWVAEVQRCAREINPMQRSRATSGLASSVPSQLKKAGALTSAVNRTKPIRSLSPKLTYDFVEKSPFQRDVVELYPSELLSFELARHMLLEAEQGRPNLAEFEDFLTCTQLSEEEIFSEAFINDICFFLRSRAPSATSMYMMYRAVFAMSYAWRKKNFEGHAAQ
ncbi:hypothetical protein [Nioella sp. MMSF_3534]|uniref:hypothetical protein n=1 Tax=Nioella sp. MMSF_3534 TaxID=3046720 RepID=UPI00273F7B1F|nr:hypothetical protein [Nioella sp. MMSF_3534]